MYIEMCVCVCVCDIIVFTQFNVLSALVVGPFGHVWQRVQRVRGAHHGACNDHCDVWGLVATVAS